MESARAYWHASRHPWSCTLFVLPLLVLYETGLHFLGSAHPESLRNGADSWLRTGLSQIGLTQGIWAPAIIVLVLFAWCIRHRKSHPQRWWAAIVGIAIECSVLALAMWVGSQAIWPLLNGHPFVPCNAIMDASALRLDSVPDPAIEKTVSFLGAGIYEEAFFRLILYSALLGIFRLANFSNFLCVALAGTFSALAFAAAHNVGPFGEPFQSPVFLFRTMAGVIFALLYQFRGFAVAVGTHVGYDVIVGVLLADCG